MNCTDFELAAQQLLDERREILPPELSDHAAHCPACRTFWHEQLTLLSAARSWTRIAASLEQMQSILTVLAKPAGVASQPLSHATPLVSRGGAWAALSTAAALMLLAAMMIRQSPSPEPRSSEPVVARPELPVPEEDAVVSQALAGLWQGVHREYEELTQETTRVFDSLSELPESSSLLPSLPAADPSPMQPPASWLRLARPVSDRVGQAFDFLRDAVPRETPQSS